MPALMWWEFVFFGICQLGIAAAAIFWSHWWRRGKQPLGAQIGHFLYFVCAWVFTSGGLFFIAGGLIASQKAKVEGALGAETGTGVIIGAIAGGLILTIMAMTLKTTK